MQASILERTGRPGNAARNNVVALLSEKDDQGSTGSPPTSATRSHCAPVSIALKGPSSKFAIGSMDGSSTRRSRGPGGYLRRHQPQRAHYTLIGDGQSVHGPDIDEDLSAEEMLHGIPVRRSPAGPVKQAAASHRVTERSSARHRFTPKAAVARWTALAARRRSSTPDSPPDRDLSEVTGFVRKCSPKWCAADSRTIDVESSAPRVNSIPEGGRYVCS